MKKGAFKLVAANKELENWDKLIAREKNLYERSGDIRSEFERDYTRILHSLAYRRLKHKTQVFFNTDNDHICTRLEHVMHVESVSSTIARYLGLNTELTRAIATGHDLGHAPFGHRGEEVLNHISNKHLKKEFWHEKNGLRFVDKLELLTDTKNNYNNLQLTYAVRDGIISHCGEVDEKSPLMPRKELMNLNSIDRPGEYMPATWEGCVVRLSDKIAYLGRDIEDAITLKFIDDDTLKILKDTLSIRSCDEINTTVIIHNMISDICKNSSPDIGIKLSEKYIKEINAIKQFNYKYIYKNKRLNAFKNYTELVINSIFEALLDMYDYENTFNNLYSEIAYYPELMGGFFRWLQKYCTIDVSEFSFEKEKHNNIKIYGNLESKEVYVQAIIDYISGMTDGYAIKVYNELLSF